MGGGAQTMHDRSGRRSGEKVLTASTAFSEISLLACIRILPRKYM